MGEASEVSVAQAGKGPLRHCDVPPAPSQVLTPAGLFRGVDRRLLILGFLGLFGLAAFLTLGPGVPFEMVVGEGSRMYGAAFLGLFLLVALVLGTDFRDWF
jgi:hypothetical protein